MNNGLHEHLRVFVAIARAGSLTAASIATDIGQATISRQLAALENHLGCRLFQRSTRAIRLTEQGEVYLQHALHLLQLAEEAEASVRQGATGLRGRLRVACSNGFGRKLLIPSLAPWQARHPHLNLELVLSDQPSHLIEDGVDVAFRTAPLQDSGLVARAIGVSRRIVVGSPAYLRRFGRPTEPSQLKDHQCILFAGAEKPGVWTFDGPGGRVGVHVKGRLALSSVDALQDAVLAGLGLAVMPAWFWGPELVDGRVVQLLSKWPLPAQDIQALTVSRLEGRGKVHSFVAHVEQALRGQGLAQAAVL